MKRKMSKILTTFAVVLGMAILASVMSVIATNSNTKMGELTIETQKYQAEKVKNFIAGDNTYPSMEGYVFAGWYNSEEFRKANAIRTPEDVPQEGAWAKFVPAQVLTVKAQVSNYLRDDVVDTKDNSAPIRFITSVDDLVYKGIGLKIEYSNAKGAQVYETSEASNKIVYKTLKAISDGLSTDLTPQSTFCSLSTYFRAHTLTGVPSDYYNTTFTVTPFWITLDGTKVEATSRALTIEEGCIREEVWVSSADGVGAKDACYYGSQVHPYKSLEYAVESMSNKATANVAKSGKVTIHIASDLSVGYELDIKNPNSIDVVIDAANGADGRYTVTTTTKDKNVFRVEKEHTGKVAIQNMILNHNCQRAAIQVKVITEANITNVDINANNPEVTYRYGIIAAEGVGVSDATTLNMTDVRVLLGGIDSKDDNQAIIRTGNDGAGNEKKVNINLVNCTLDASLTTGKKAIAVMSTTEAQVNARDTRFKTNNQIPIYDNSGNAKIVKTRCVMDVTDSGWDSVVATIGTTKYTTFEDVRLAANQSTKDVTIEMLNDVTLTKETIFENGPSGSKAITIDGNGYHLTANWNDGNHSLTIKDKTTNRVEFKNMTLVAQNKGSVVRASSGVPTDFELRFTDVKLDATNPAVDVDGSATIDKNYNWALIQVEDVKTTVNLTLTRVDAAMKANAIVAEPNRTGMAIIRTGNADQTKTVNIKLVGSKLDTTEATLRSGIVLMDNTTAKIELLEDTSAERNSEMDPATIINTKDILPIVNYSTKEVTIDESGYKNNLTEKEATVGNRVYSTFEEALTAANSATSDVKIQLLKDVAIDGNLDIKNTSNKTVTIDGAGHEITAGKSGVSHTFMIRQTGTVAFNHIILDHRNSGSLIQIYTAATVKLTDVNIDATQPLDTTNGYQYTLINTLETNATTTVELDNVNVDMDTSLPAKDNDAAIIRTGNGNNTVNIKLTDCTLDATGATKRSGIVVMSSSAATITTSNTDIRTKNVYPIKNNNLTAGKVTVNGANYTSSMDDPKGTIADNLVAEIDRNLYPSLTDAIAVAKTASGDTTIKLWKDITVSSSVDMLQANKKAITIDGQNHTISATYNGNTFRVGEGTGNIGKVTFKNMTINQTAGSCVLQIKKITTVDMTGVTINATGVHQYCLINMMATGTDASTILNLTDTTINLHPSGTPDNLGIIRTGNSDEPEKKVEIHLTRTILNAEGATGGSGIRIMNTTNATVTLADHTAIKTKDTVPIYNASTKTVSITDDDTCTYSATDREAAIGNATYTNIAGAMNVAKESATDTTIYLLKDVSLGSAYTLGETTDTKAQTSATITIEGLGRKITVAKDVYHAFTFKNSYKTCIAFHNTDFVHHGAGALFQVDTVATVFTLSLTDGTIDATDPSGNSDNNYRWAIINMFAKTTTNLEMTNMTATMKAPTNNNDYVAFIRTGNDGTSDEKTVNITLSGTTIDTSGAAMRNGISIMNTTKAHVILQNGTTITTAEDGYAIRRKVTGGTTTDAIKAATEVTIEGGCTLASGTKTDGDAINGIDGKSIPGPNTHRVVMVADMHYTVEETEKNSMTAGQNPSLAAGNTFGYTQAQKIGFIKSDIVAYASEKSIDAVLVLGDLSLDDCGFRNLGTNFVSKFKTDCMDDLAKLTTTGKAYAIAGNHDSYSSVQWNSIFGYNRKYSFTIGNAAFIMMDTFDDKGNNATDASGSPYVGVDTKWLKTEIAKYTDVKQIFLCAHYLDSTDNTSTYTDAFKEILNGDSRIKCLFDAHIHYNSNRNIEGVSQKQIDIGGYAYKMINNNGTCLFNEYDENYVWGYQVLEWDDNGAFRTYHVKPARDYTDSSSVVHPYLGRNFINVLTKTK